MPDDVRLKRRLSAGLGARRHRATRVTPGTPPGTLIATGTQTPARISVPTYNREGAYAWALGLMLAAGMITYFKRRGWW